MQCCMPYFKLFQTLCSRLEAVVDDLTQGTRVRACKWHQSSEQPRLADPLCIGRACHIKQYSHLSFF